MTLQETMRCVEISAPGGPEVLRLAERPVPQPGAGEVLIKIASAGVNRPDILQRQGLYPPPEGASDLLGLECAGEVVALGEGAERWRLGDKVVALLNGGGYAEFVAVPGTQCLPWPTGLTAPEAASLPEAVFTVWANLVELGGMAEGRTALVHGGTSGIGVIALQMAKALGGRVMTTVSGPDKVRRAGELGADPAIDYKTEDFVAKVMKATHDRGVDCVLDMVGGEYLARNVACLAERGVHVSIATLGGAKGELDLLTVLRKNLVLTGSTLRPRSTTEKARLAVLIEAKIWPLITAGKLRPVLDRVLPLAEAGTAHQRMEAGGHIGKIILAVG